MGRAVSVQSMIDSARRMTKTETLDEANAFCTNAELLEQLNVEIAELEDAIIAAQDEEYSAAIAPIALVAGQSLYPLPVDDYKITGVDVQWTPQVKRSAKRLTNAERNRFQSITPSWTYFGKVYYRTLGSNIEFVPTPTSAITVYVNYTPTFDGFTSYGEAYDSKNGWHMAAVYGLAAYIALADNDTERGSFWESKKQAQLARVTAMAGSRVTGEAPRVQTTRGSGYLEEDG